MCYIQVSIRFYSWVFMRNFVRKVLGILLLVGSRDFGCGIIRVLGLWNKSNFNSEIDSLAVMNLCFQSEERYCYISSLLQ